MLKPLHIAALAAAFAAAPVRAQDAPLAPCLAQLRDDARAAGVGSAAFDQFTRGLVADMGVVVLLDDQPEFRTAIWDYLAALVDEQRVADGRAMLAQWKDTLDAVERRFGVDAATVVAVWGRGK